MHTNRAGLQGGEAEETALGNHAGGAGKGSNPHGFVSLARNGQISSLNPNSNPLWWQWCSLASMNH